MCEINNTAPHGCVEMDRISDGEKRDGPGGSQPPGPLMIVTHLTQVGVIIRLGDNRRMAPINPDGLRIGSLTPAEETRRDHPVLEGVNRVLARNSTMEPISRSERDGGRMAPLGRNKGVPRRRMRPAGATDGSSRCQKCKGKVRRGGGGVLSYTGPGNEAYVWTEVHVQRSRRGCPGGSCRCPCSDGGGMIEDDILVVQASEQRTVCNTDPGRVPTTLSVPAGDTLVAEQWKHSAQKIDLDGTPMEEIVVLEPLAFSVTDVSLDSRPMAGKMDRQPFCKKK